MKYFILFLLCISCGGDDFRKVEKLDGFRVLGIVADKPEVADGETVNVQVLITDVNGVESSISGTYEHCIDPGISRGAAVQCSHDPSSNPIPITISFTALIPNSEFRTGLSQTFPVIVPFGLLNGRSVRESFNGVGYIVIFKFNVNDQELTSFKRIIVTNRGSLNTNPSGSALLLNDSPISGAPVDGDKLSVTTSLPESYSVVNVDGIQENRLEKYEISWYTNSGTFSKPKAFINEIVDYKGDDPSTLTLALIRDERGGLDFVKASYP
jgi:hypothetical protein